MAIDSASSPLPGNVPWFRSWADSTIVAAMGSRILIADDEPHIRAVVRAYLEREGYEVLEAEDGETALEHGRNDALDLLILDVMLPGRSGFDILRALRSEGSNVGVLKGLPRLQEGRHPALGRRGRDLGEGQARQGGVRG
jgi:CheY-like chemotaxis protein